MTAGRYNAEFDQGSHFILTVEDWTDADGNIVNTTGYSAKFAINNDNDTATTIATGSTASEIVITQTPGVTNKIVVTFAPGATSTWPLDAMLFYELAMFGGSGFTGVRTSLLKGRLIGSPKVVA